MGLEKYEYDVIRRLADGWVYALDKRGRRIKVQIQKCANCPRELNAQLFEKTRICPDCAAADRAARRDVAGQRGRVERLKAADTPIKRRSSRKLLATPKWRDAAKIRAIYKEARDKTAQTGIKHQVDHFYPIQGAWCTGLHVHQNLRVITATENSIKRDSHPLQDSPALRMAIDEWGEMEVQRMLAIMRRDARC